MLGYFMVVSREPPQPGRMFPHLWSPHGWLFHGGIHPDYLKALIAEDEKSFSNR